jgi:thiamine-monophosphate kinase
MIDLSDGIATDAAHLGRASGACVEVELDALPLAEGVAEVAGELGIEPWRLAAGGGEDYELCFCAAPEARERIEKSLAAPACAPLTWVGTVREGPPGARLLDARSEEVSVRGFEHRW